MDCIDCHNRPTHIYYGADEAVDLALEREFIEKDLPYIKREGVRAISDDWTKMRSGRRRRAMARPSGPSGIGWVATSAVEAPRAYRCNSTRTAAPGARPA